MDYNYAFIYEGPSTIHSTVPVGSSVTVTGVGINGNVNSYTVNDSNNYEKEFDEKSKAIIKDAILKALEKIE